MANPVTRLGWIGLGRIGRPMAARLIQRGFGVAGWDTSPDAISKAAELGIERAKSGADVARRADVCFLCLPGEDAIEATIFGPDGVAAAAKSMIVVDHSSIDPGICRQFAERAAQSGIKWVDMPVSGGVDLAASGKLIAWAGGDETDIDLLIPIVSCYIAKLRRMGGIGQGQLAKSCNQMIVAGTIALWSEMLRYAENVGLDPANLIETLGGGAADSPVSRRFAAALAKNDMPRESIRNMIKDLKVALGQASEEGVSPNLARAALEEFEDHIKPRS